MHVDEGRMVWCELPSYLRERHNTNRCRVYSIKKSGDLVVNPLQSQGSVDGLDSNACT